MNNPEPQWVVEAKRKTAESLELEQMTVEQIDSLFKSAEASIVALSDYAERGGREESAAAKQRFFWLANHLFDRDILDDLNACIDNGSGGPKHVVAKHRPESSNPEAIISEHGK